MTNSSGTTNSPGANCNGDSRPEGRGAGTAPSNCNDTRASADRPARGAGEAQDGPSTNSSGTTNSPGANCNGDSRPEGRGAGTAPSNCSGGSRPSLQIEPATGLLTGTLQVLSPHFDARPKGVAPDLIVVHGITLPPGEFGGPWIDRLFAGDLRPDSHPALREHAKLRVSAHAVIRRDGTITQYVPFGMRAWHAGQSEYRGRSGCNDFSIGIELEGTDVIPYADAQYESLAGLVKALLATYPTLSPDRIAGHSDIAPGRKTDPGPVFDWQRWRKLLAEQR